MKIAIQGHSTRGKEVIQILESLGGKNTNHLHGDNYDGYYCILGDNQIICVFSILGHKVYTLEKFEKEFPFKIGDKVICSHIPNLIGTVVDIKFDDIISYRINIKGAIFTCGTNMLKSYNEMKEERNITLTLDKAKEWYKKGGELKEVALQAFTEKELNPLPRSWKEFCEKYPVQGCEAHINTMSVIIVHPSPRIRDIDDDRNICPSMKSAEAHLAMIQLEQLRNCWWNGWESIWDCSEKWCIGLWGNELTIGTTKNISRFLTFPTKEMAEEFLKCFRDLIEKAGDLI